MKHELRGYINIDHSSAVWQYLLRQNLQNLQNQSPYVFQYQDRTSPWQPTLVQKH